MNSCLWPDFWRVSWLRLQRINSTPHLTCVPWKPWEAGKRQEITCLDPLTHMISTFSKDSKRKSPHVPPPEVRMVAGFFLTGDCITQTNTSPKREPSQISRGGSTVSLSHCSVRVLESSRVCPHYTSPFIHGEYISKSPSGCLKQWVVPNPYIYYVFSYTI